MSTFVPFRNLCAWKAKKQVEDVRFLLTVGRQTVLSVFLSVPACLNSIARAHTAPAAALLIGNVDLPAQFGSGGQRDQTSEGARPGLLRSTVEYCALELDVLESAVDAAVAVNNQSGRGTA